MKIFTDRSLTSRMGAGAAGFSSTWSLIDPLIAGIGHRAMTPATPPGFQSDGTLFRQKSVDVSFPKGCAFDVWRAFILEWLLVWQTSERTSTTITENPTCSCWSSEARRKEEQILQVTKYITAMTIMSHSCWNKTVHFMISFMFRSYFISHFFRYRCHTFQHFPNISFWNETLPFCCHSWKWVCCLRAASLIMHLTCIWIRLWPWGCDSPALTFSPLCANKGPRSAFPHRHLETSLSCPRFLFHKKNECIVACASYGNNFWNSLTVKSNGFALFLRWNWCQYAKFSCVLFYVRHSCLDVGHV